MAQILNKWFDTPENKDFELGGCLQGVGVFRQKGQRVAFTFPPPLGPSRKRIE